MILLLAFVMLIYCFDWDKVKVCRRKGSHVFREFASVFAGVLHAVKCTKNMIFFSLTKFDLVPIKTIDNHQKCQQDDPVTMKLNLLDAE